MGAVLLEKGDPAGAVGCFREAVRLNPRYALAYRNLGVALQQKGDLDGAEAAYREAARLDPKRFGALLKKLPLKAVPVAPPPRAAGR